MTFFNLQDCKDGSKNGGWKTTGASNGTRQNVSTLFVCFMEGIEATASTKVQRLCTRIYHLGTFCYRRLQNIKLVSWSNSVFCQKTNCLDFSGKRKISIVSLDVVIAIDIIVTQISRVRLFQSWLTPMWDWKVLRIRKTIKWKTSNNGNCMFDI